MTIVASKIKPTRMGTAATTEIEEINKETIPKRTVGTSENTGKSRTGMATVATRTVVASKNAKLMNQMMCTPRLANRTLPKLLPLLRPLPLSRTETVVVAKVMVAEVAEATATMTSATPVAVFSTAPLPRRPVDAPMNLTTPVRIPTMAHLSMSIRTEFQSMKLTRFH